MLQRGSGTAPDPHQAGCRHGGAAHHVQTLVSPHHDGRDRFRPRPVESPLRLLRPCPAPYPQRMTDHAHQRSLERVRQTPEISHSVSPKRVGSITAPPAVSNHIDRDQLPCGERFDLAEPIVPIVISTIQRSPPVHLVMRYPLRHHDTEVMAVKGPRHALSGSGDVASPDSFHGRDIVDLAEGFEHLILLASSLRSSSRQAVTFRCRPVGTERTGAANTVASGDRTTGQHDICTCHGSGRDQ